jgi:hypothetical protein
MRTTFRLLVLFAMLCVPLAVQGAAPDGPNDARRLRAPLEAQNHSHLSGFVEAWPASGGGSWVRVVAQGVRRDSLYAAYVESRPNCEAHDLLGTFTGDASGNGLVEVRVDRNIEEIGSVSVRLAPDPTALLACARMR